MLEFQRDTSTRHIRRDYQINYCSSIFDYKCIIVSMSSVLVSTAASVRASLLGVGRPASSAGLRMRGEETGAQHENRGGRSHWLLPGRDAGWSLVPHPSSVWAAHSPYTGGSKHKHKRNQKRPTQLVFFLAMKVKKCLVQCG